MPVYTSLGLCWPRWCAQSVLLCEDRESVHEDGFRGRRKLSPAPPSLQNWTLTDQTALSSKAPPTPHAQ